MSPTCLLVANRGEIAVRILRAAAELGLATATVYSEDDAASLHIRRADLALPLLGSGAAAYLDAGQIVTAAGRAGCDMVHPGYGFLSEHAGFARRCAEAGLTFVGPRPDLLELLGDKVEARALAGRCGVPVLAGSPEPVDEEEARAFLAGLGPGRAMMIKAVAGGGGRGMRVVRELAEVADAYARCRSEAAAAFGVAEVFVEQLMPRARHIEVQILGDGSGAVSHLGERECTIQRRHQKVIEMAPSRALTAPVRTRLLAAAVRMAEAVRYDNLGTFEFLVDAAAADPAAAPFAFVEANPRLQVEHTVTEEVTGIDLVKTQLRLAGGASLADLGLGPLQVPSPHGRALQVRVNMESMGSDGTTRPAGAPLSAFEPPSGPGVRVDTFGYAGYRPSPRFDSLLAKVIAHVPSGDFAELVTRTDRALSEFRIEGTATNIGFLQALLAHPDFRADRVDTRWVEDHIGELAPATGGPGHRRLWWDGPGPGATSGAAAATSATPATRARRAGALVDPADPLAVLAHGKSAPPAVSGPAATVSLPDDPSISRSDPAGGPGWAADPDPAAGPAGTTAVLAPVQGTVVAVDVGEGDVVHAGQQLLVMEAMKMEHVVAAPAGGLVRQLAVAVGDTVFEGHALAFLEETEVAAVGAAAGEDVDLDAIRPDLAEVHERHRVGLDEARPDAVGRRRRTGQRTTRENIADLCDSGSFVEYGALTLAAQRRRHTVAELIARTPADGLVGGVGTVNGAVFGPSGSRCVVMSYDYTVLAGTQGLQNHRKKDRLFELAERSRLPVVVFAEGGGGRPGDTDGLGMAGLDCMAFHLFGGLSGLVPLVGIVSGRCFAGNAALLGCCDVIIATADANIGMGGPAMVEGGGLGVFRPEEIGPIDVQVGNGVVDLAVADEAEAVGVAKRYLTYFQGPTEDWECADQRLLRTAVPENRLRIYDVRRVIDTIADVGSVLELRRGFGPGMVTALARIEGRPIGVIANNPTHLAGAIDSNGADKAARFMQLCNAFDLPILFLCDTPGIMVGPEAEKTGLVRHASRMFVTGASLGVPFCTIVLRKGYGLGAQAMAGGSFKAGLFTVAWPTGEFGGMGLEGAVKLGYRKELAAIDDPQRRRAEFDERVARMYEHGKAVSTASHFEIDDVIDPVDSRRWILSSLPPWRPRTPGATGRHRPVDTW